MKERSLKYVLGILLIVSHLGLIVYSMYLYALRGFRIEEFTTILAILAPIFAGYTTSILAFIIREKKAVRRSSARVTLVYCAFSLLLPGALVALVAVSMYLKAHNQVFDDFEDFKRFVLLIESVFGAYVGMFVYSLFSQREPRGMPREPDAGDSK